MVDFSPPRPANCSRRSLHRNVNYDNNRVCSEQGAKMNAHPQTPPTSVRLLFGVGRTSLAALVLATSLWMGKAEATVAFQQDTRLPCSSCHATPGTNMRAFTGLGNCFRRSGYNISDCTGRRRPPPGDTGSRQNCRTRTTTIEQDGRVATRRETVCD